MRCCSKCLSTILKILEKCGVNIRIFKAIQLFKLGCVRTECVGQTIIFSDDASAIKKTKNNWRENM